MKEYSAMRCLEQGTSDVVRELRDQAAIRGNGATPRGMIRGRFLYKPMRVFEVNEYLFEFISLQSPGKGVSDGRDEPKIGWWEVEERRRPASRMLMRIARTGTACT